MLWRAAPQASVQSCVLSWRRAVTNRVHEGTHPGPVGSRRETGRARVCSWLLQQMDWFANTSDGQIVWKLAAKTSEGNIQRSTAERGEEEWAARRSSTTGTYVCTTRRSLHAGGLDFAHTPVHRYRSDTGIYKPETRASDSWAQHSTQYPPPVLTNNSQTKADAPTRKNDNVSPGSRPAPRPPPSPSAPRY